MPKIIKEIPYSRQVLDHKDIKAVNLALTNDFITQGPKVSEFEKKIAKIVKSKYAISVNSATSALHLCCLAIEIKKNDIVWTTPNSFVASANCALYCGAEIDFVDIDTKTRNMSLNLLEEKLIISKKQNKLPKAIIPVHFSGNPVDMEQLLKIVKKFGDIKIIEDASHALGAKSSEINIGSCKFSDLTVFSFHPVKMITTAEGGMVTTNNKKLADIILMLRSHGIERKKQKLLNNNFLSNQHPIYYEQHLLGYNYRMPDILATLGTSQADKLNSFVESRNIIAEYYYKMFSNSSLILPEINKKDISSFHLYVIEVKKNRNRILNTLRNKGILASIHYIPIHFHPYYQKLGFKLGDFPNSEKYYANCISIPIYPKLKREDQDFVIEQVLNLI